MVPELFKHQRVGARFMADRSACIIADEPGAGKTPQAVRACDLIGAKRVLVLAPAAVKEHWAREFQKWGDPSRSVTVLPGHPKTIPGHGVTIASHEAMVKPSTAYLLSGGADYDAVIVDESHQFRSFTAQRTYRLYGSESQALWRHTRHLWCLTGTPIVNSAMDIYPFSQGPLHCEWTWQQFAETFADKIVSNMSGELSARGVKNHDRLAGAMQPYFLRRTLAGIGIRLPPLDIQTVPLKVAPAELTKVMAVLAEWSPSKLEIMLETRDELKDAAVSRVRHVLGLAKVPMLADGIRWMLVTKEGPIVVFYQHTAVRDAMRAALADTGAQMSWISGDITRPQLTAAEQWFQAGRVDVLFVQNQAGGMGLTLTRGNQVVVAELPWTAAELWQMLKRVHRITQDRPVTARICVAENCWLENVLLGVIGRKHRASEELLNRLTARPEVLAA